MDRRSWLWRRKSFDKTPGETTGSSGSVSSISGRYFEDQEVLKSSPTDIQSPEVSSNTITSDDQHIIKELRVKLSTAIANLSAKEELVQQHAKVAEDAVSGWEKAETEVGSLRQQVEAANQKQSALQERVDQLDGALKECIRKLRLAGEEQEEKVHDAVVEKISEWMDDKAKLESQLVELEAQLEERNSAVSETVIREMQLRLKAVEEDNSLLKRNHVIQSEKIRVQNLEVELSNQAAEAASKQHLESIKKVVKAESECRMLRAVIRKLQSHSDQKPFLSSVYTESLPDPMVISLNDATSCKDELNLNHAESLKRRNGEDLLTSFLNTSTTDDFLAVEKLVASQEINQNPVSSSCNTSVTDDLQTAVRRTSELENKITKLESENEDLAGMLAETQEKLEKSADRLREVGSEVMELQKKLDSTCASKQFFETEAKAADEKRKALELQVEAVDSEVQQLREKVHILEQSLDKQRKLAEEFAAQCQKLEHESSKQREGKMQQATITAEKLKIKQERELAAAAKKFRECQKTITSLGLQLKSLENPEKFCHDAWNPENGTETIEEEGRNLFSGVSPGSFDDDLCTSINCKFINTSLYKCVHQDRPDSNIETETDRKIR